MIFLGDETQYPKKAQIKIRYLKEINLSEISISNSPKILNLSLQLKEASDNFYYISGPLRANYVSKHPSKWKTTIYVKNKQDAVSLLSLLCPIVGEEFDECNLSFTEGRVTTQLQQPDQDARNKAVKMSCHKAVFFLKGSNRPMTLFKRITHHN